MPLEVHSSLVISSHPPAASLSLYCLNLSSFSRNAPLFFDSGERGSYSPGPGRVSTCLLSLGNRGALANIVEQTDGHVEPAESDVGPDVV